MLNMSFYKMVMEVSVFFLGRVQGVNSPTSYKFVTLVKFLLRISVSIQNSSLSSQKQTGVFK